MTNSMRADEPVALMISDIVQPDRIPEYEAWSREINQEVKKFDGFLGVDIFRPRDAKRPEYVTIVRFDRYEHLKAWQESATCRECLQRLRDLVAGEAHVHVAGGLEIWFSLPKDAVDSAPHPAYYKMVIVGTLAVYPLIYIVSTMLGPFLEGLPEPIALLISVIAVSALMTKPVLPWLTRVLDFWLYPASTGSRS